MVVTLFLLGFLLHRTQDMTSKLRYGWRNIADHSIGGVAVILLWPFLARRMGMKKDEIRKGETALILSFLDLGGGVVFGYIYAPVRERMSQ